MQNNHLVINALIKLGDKLKAFTPEELNHWCQGAKRNNPWFSEDNVEFSLSHWSNLLTEQNIFNWLNQYPNLAKTEKNIGVVAAGNIPLVGFHDAICVLLTGNILKLKCSTDDTFLMTKMLDSLVEFEPSIKDKYQLVDRLKDIDAIIATGSNNTSRYFEYYFSQIPHIIRSNRTSVAVLTGNETIEDFKKLAKDVFTYFGLGCRNVTKLYLPINYDFIPLLDEWTHLTKLLQHHKYANNYEYHRGIFLMNRIPIFDNGIVILKKDSNLYSAVSVINYEYYENEQKLNKHLQEEKSKIQCILSQNDSIYGALPLGTAQSPALNTYADDIDIINFLQNIN